MWKLALVAVGFFFLWVLLLYLRRLRDIHACARAGMVDRARRLLDESPERREARNGAGELPAHQAAKYGQVEVLRLLSERGADLAATTPEGVTPLHLAAGFGEEAAVRFLLERGVPVDAREELGMTPHMAARAGGHEAIATLLAAAGADADAIPLLVRAPDGHLVMPVRDDDPLMTHAVERARESLPVLRALLAERSGDATVKFAFRTDQGEIEHLWGRLVELGDRTFRVEVRTRPLAHRGRLDRDQEEPLEVLEDWQVLLDDGRIRGGFGTQATIARVRTQLGRLPRELAAQVPLFIDRDPEDGLAGG